jgi:hypothetical protein
MIIVNYNDSFDAIVSIGILADCHPDRSEGSGCVDLKGTDRPSASLSKTHEGSSAQTSEWAD